MRPTVLSLCDLSGEMVRPWAEAGYDCICVDLQHPEGSSATDGRITLVGADLLRWLPPLRRYAAAFAFPDCTNLCVSGARHFQRKGLRAVIDGFELVERCREILEWTGAPYLLENPVGVLSSWWRRPDFIFDPCDFALLADDPASEAHTKRTCLWTGGGFVMPECAGTRVEPTGNRPGMPNEWISKVGGKSQRTKNYRSRTPRGFARAVFEANHKASVLEPRAGTDGECK